MPRECPYCPAVLKGETALSDHKYKAHRKEWYEERIYLSKQRIAQDRLWIAYYKEQLNIMGYAPDGKVL